MRFDRQVFGESDVDQTPAEQFDAVVSIIDPLMPALSKRPSPRQRASDRSRPGKAAAPIAVTGPSATPPRISALEPYAQRLSRARALLERQELGHLLVTDPIDVGYLTGFLGGDSYLLLSVDKRSLPVILSDSRYEEELGHLECDARVVIRKTTLLEATANLLREHGVRSCGIQADHMTVAERDNLDRHTRAAQVSLHPTTGLIGALRAIKDALELALMRRAVWIQEHALLEVLPTIRPNQTELEIAARLEAAMKLRGSSAPGFETIIAARANSALPHYRPQTTKTGAGKLLLIDWGATYRGYRGDMTRTFCLGRWPAKMRTIYQIVLEAHEKAVAALAAGRESREIDAVAREHITSAGYGPQFGHGLGHGVGMRVHEEPRLSHMGASAPLKAGNVVTIEPGIYLPGIGGVRIENDYVVSETGASNLCSLPLSIEWATL